MTTDDIFDRTVHAIRSTIDRFSEVVKPPSLVDVNGGKTYRYMDAGPHHALVLKLVRLLSALLSLRVLLERGLYLDAASMMRISDEIQSDIMFVAGPIIWETDAEPAHNQFLAEFFQEEFDNVDPIKSSQKRSRVPRKKIRAYIAKAFTADGNTSVAIDVIETLDLAFSGFVHGAAVHILDVYDGKSFQVPMGIRESRLEDLQAQRNAYSFRSLTSAILVAKAFGDEDRCKSLYELCLELFDEFGRDRLPTGE